MKRTFITAAFCLIQFVPALAQNTKTPPPPPPKVTATPAVPALPTVDQILEKFVQALGGKAAINKHTSRVTKGTVEIPAANLTGTLEAYDKAPNKTVTIMVLPGYGLAQSGYDGKAAWSQDPQSGINDLKGSDLAAFVREADFYKNLNMKTHYPKMEVKRKERLGDRETYVIEATPAIGDPETLYFDVETGLFVRQDVERETPQGKINITNEFDDYKEVDGVKLAFTARQLLPSFTMIFKITEVKHDEPIDDAKFAKPVVKTAP